MSERKRSGVGFCWCVGGRSPCIVGFSSQDIKGRTGFFLGFVLYTCKKYAPFIVMFYNLDCCCIWFACEIKVAVRLIFIRPGGMYREAEDTGMTG